MDIRTIEQAMQDMGDRLGRPDMTQRARAAVEAGDALEVTIRIAPTKRDRGIVVTMESFETSTKTSHGRLIDLE